MFGQMGALLDNADVSKEGSAIQDAMERSGFILRQAMFSDCKCDMTSTALLNLWRVRKNCQCLQISTWGIVLVRCSPSPSPKSKESCPFVCLTTDQEQPAGINMSSVPTTMRQSHPSIPSSLPLWCWTFIRSSQMDGEALTTRSALRKVSVVMESDLHVCSSSAPEVEIVLHRD